MYSNPSFFSQTNQPQQHLPTLLAICSQQSKMEARFGRIILRQVDKALEEEPNREALLNLLQIADPSFQESDLGNPSRQEKAVRALKLLIHPDKHKNDQSATERFQKTQNFFEQALQAPGESHNGRKKRKRSTATHFHVQDPWPFLSHLHKEPVAPASITPDAVQLEKMIAYKCINYRGAIAHGKNTELRYDFNSVQTNAAESAIQLFQGHGGYKQLHTVQEIKDELQTRGPVISTSFHLQAFLNSHEDELSMSCHPVLIVGWKETEWLVRTFKGDTDICIAIGQYSMEEQVLAPTHDFTDEMWQKEDKVYVAPGLPSPDWYHWTAIILTCSSSKLEALFQDLNCSWGTALANREPFVIREETNKARSRYAHLTDIAWDRDKKQWQISADFCDEEWTS
jgi:hypothetical protein